MGSRRTFFRRAIAGITLVGLFPFIKESKGAEVKIKGTLVHHVFFWMKEPDNKEQKNKIKKGINELLKVETIKMSHVGVPAKTEDRAVVDQSFTFSYMVFFDSIEGQNIYQSHPLHLKFIEDCSNLFEKVVVYDATDMH